MCALEGEAWLAAVKAAASPHLPMGWEAALAVPGVAFGLNEDYEDGVDPEEAASDLVWSLTN